MEPESVILLSALHKFFISLTFLLCLPSGSSMPKPKPHGLSSKI